MPRETNSRYSRIEPAFEWLRDNNPPDWPDELLRLANGHQVNPDCGKVQTVCLERGVAATEDRLLWMLSNVDTLASQIDAEKGTKFRERVASVAAGLSAYPLERHTFADCLIECERVILWIEGKRNDTLSLRTQWDKKRDQLARNLEAAWTLSKNCGKDFCVLICYENQLKPSEQALIGRYRNPRAEYGNGNYTDGLPHIPEDKRQKFASRIGTVTWTEICAKWPAIPHNI